LTQRLRVLLLEHAVALGFTDDEPAVDHRKEVKLLDLTLSLDDMFEVEAETCDCTAADGSERQGRDTSVLRQELVRDLAELVADSRDGWRLRRCADAPQRMQA
jgi:predicted secreted protein